MKNVFLLAAAVVTFLLTSCGGPSESELRAELQRIEAEMTQLNIIAYDLKSQMSQAEWQSFFGGFATTYGAIGGDGQLALQGAGTALDAVGSYDRASYSYQQVSDRWFTLQKRRLEILERL